MENHCLIIRDRIKLGSYIQSETDCTIFSRKELVQARGPINETLNKRKQMNLFLLALNQQRTYC